MKNTIFSEYTNVAVEAALKAGKYLKSCFRTIMDIQSKDGKFNIVTECDFNAERQIIEHVKKYYPNHTFMAEESGLTTNTHKVKWIIDPLDGTVNFAHGIPLFAVSIAVEIQKKIVSGIVFQPMTEELFIAEDQKGAYLNYKKINVSNNDSLKKALLATGFPYNIGENPNNCIEKFISVLHTGTPIRRLGSAALDLCYVALNCFDAFFEISLAPWDIAAGKLIIEEAKGKLTQWNGSNFDIYSYMPVLASNSFIHSQLINILK